MTEQAQRFCPQCDAETAGLLCPHDGSTTLMRNPPHFDIDREAQIGLVVANRYRLSRELGRGGFGAVFGAQHTGTGQQVAIKLLSSQGDASQQKRFFREAQVTAALKSKHTIRVIDFGQDDQGLSYLVMELLTGRTVDAWVRERDAKGHALSEREAVEVGIAVCKSLGEAHNAGLVHRDMKPQNLFCADTEDGPTVKVLDFGIVKVSDQSMTGDAIIGTTNYMSPEQALSGKLDGRSDLYSLGVVLYELVSCWVPFESETPVQTLIAHIHQEPPPLAERARSPLSAEFLRIVDVLLAKQPDQRFANAAELLAALVALHPNANTALGEPWPSSLRGAVDGSTATGLGDAAVTTTGAGGATFVRSMGAPTHTGSARARPAATSLAPSGAPVTMPTGGGAGPETMVLGDPGVTKGLGAHAAATEQGAQPAAKAKLGLWIGVGAAAIVGLVVAGVALGGKPAPAAVTAAATAPAAGEPAPAAQPAPVVAAPAPVPTPATAVAAVPAPVVAPLAAPAPQAPTPTAPELAPSPPAAAAAPGVKATAPRKAAPKKAGSNALHRDL